jgi:bis(5'-nucleosyl)-tetraphosphatase (symmetrical)
MATYVIGDVHGCFVTLRRLLRRIQYDRRHDRLWIVGDLVNRGPRSLETLRWGIAQGDRLVTVLGNHDFHLLARAADLLPPKRRDTLDNVLEARDRDDLLNWVRTRPLLHREGDFVMVHAGLLPDWTIKRAERLARDIERRLRRGPAHRLIVSAAGKEAARWRPRQSASQQARAAVAAFARLRILDRSGEIRVDFSGGPAEAPRGCRPWFMVPQRKSAKSTILCGHWAAMGLRIEPGLAALDTGCVWGRRLTALRLDDGKVFSERTARDEGHQ